MTYKEWIEDATKIILDTISFACTLERTWCDGDAEGSSSGMCFVASLGIIRLLSTWFLISI